VQTCARCGHTAPLLGASINGRKYCHTFSETYPTCYMLTQWEQSSLQLPWINGMSGMEEERG
jgi:hypothetical protein